MGIRPTKLAIERQPARNAPVLQVELCARRSVLAGPMNAERLSVYVQRRTIRRPVSP